VHDEEAYPADALLATAGRLAPAAAASATTDVPAPILAEPKPD
jgi:hypothetical protein